MCAMIHCAMVHVRIHARTHVYTRVYMSNPFAHAHNAHKLLDRMPADYKGWRMHVRRPFAAHATAWGGHARNDGVRLASRRARNAVNQKKAAEVRRLHRRRQMASDRFLTYF